jgi:hypothetical protein
MSTMHGHEHNAPRADAQPREPQQRGCTHRARAEQRQGVWRAERAPTRLRTTQPAANHSKKTLGLDGTRRGAPRWQQVGASADGRRMQL